MLWCERTLFGSKNSKARQNWPAPLDILIKVMPNLLKSADTPLIQAFLTDFLTEKLLFFPITLSFLNLCLAPNSPAPPPRYHFLLTALHFLFVTSYFLSARFLRVWVSSASTGYGSALSLHLTHNLSGAVHLRDRVQGQSWGRRCPLLVVLW